MIPTTENKFDTLITGFKPICLIDFFVAMVWVGISPVLLPSYILSVTGSATVVALMLSLMSPGAFAVPMLLSVTSPLHWWSPGRTSAWIWSPT